VDDVFTPGATYAISVVVNGNTYQAFVDPDGVFDTNSVLLTTLVDSTFSSGRVGLYDFSPGMSFSNFSVSGTLAPPPPPPPPPIFTDNFSPPSSLWSNSIGNWAAFNGHYFAQSPNNNPTTYSGLPYHAG